MKYFLTVQMKRKTAVIATGKKTVIIIVQDVTENMLMKLMLLLKIEQKFVHEYKIMDKCVDLNLTANHTLRMFLLE